jgi:hypothetical protein
MVTRPGGEGRINLRQVKVLCVDSNSQGLEILGQMLMGFGVDKISRCQSGREAREALKVNEYDLRHRSLASRKRRRTGAFHARDHRDRPHA